MSLAFAFKADAQECVLKVGAWESFPVTEETDNGGVARKSTVDDLTATATNQSSGEVFNGTFLSGYAYFKNMPEGEYKVTVKKDGFQTTISPHKLACDTASAGFNFVYVLIRRGSSSEIVEARPVKELRLDRMVILGSADRTPVEGPVPPKPPPAPARSPLSGGGLNAKAVFLPKPEYPAEAQAAKASGSVKVQVLIDEAGNVVWAVAVSGHPSLRSAAEGAARVARFSPTYLAGVPVKVSGVITYNFVP